MKQHLSMSRQQLIAERAWVMRHALTRSESALWEAIRGRRLGTIFRRQVVIGGRYIVDFLAPRGKLVVEVDGASHNGRTAADARRDRELMRLGYRVLRVDAEVVLRQLVVAVEQIRAALGHQR
jgi:very-short-patch-repair endonuclease